MRRHTRRAFLGQLAAATLATAMPGTLRGQIAPARRRPNVLFIMSDDMRVDLGCYASIFNAKTPNLDALAKAGVRFDRNYCQFPLCNPPRASLLTGQNPTKTSVLGNRTNFREAHPDWTTLPQVFMNNGYVTVRAGKIYHGGIDDAKSWSATSDKGGATDTGRAAYSDRIVVLDGNGETHGDYLTAERTIANLRRYKDRPFFIACGFVKPHSPPTTAINLAKRANGPRPARCLKWARASL
ncbi:MAG: sulfatase-like hydrolase/transferase [Tepidisphaeraceae bacterium]|jgi:arylsulfatase A-like enzyme